MPPKKGRGRPKGSKTKASKASSDVIADNISNPTSFKLKLPARPQPTVNVMPELEQAPEAPEPPEHPSSPQVTNNAQHEPEQDAVSVANGEQSPSHRATPSSQPHITKGVNWSFNFRDDNFGESEDDMPNRSNKTVDGIGDKRMVVESDSSDSEEDVEVVTSVRKGKMPRLPSEEPQDAPFSIVLMIPQLTGSKETSKRVSVLSDISYSSLCKTIFTTIGCMDVRRKPELTYKLSITPQKLSAIGLSSPEDWQGLCDDIANYSTKKNSRPVSANIFISEQYKKSLLAHQRDGDVSDDEGGKKKRGKTKKTKLLDLDGGSGGENEDDSLAEKQCEAMIKLKGARTSCQQCGDKVWCMLTALGQHVDLTHNQRRAWAIALALGTNGVSLSRPPDNQLFAAFHKPASQRHALGTLGTASSAYNPMFSQGQHPMMASPYGMPGMPPFGWYPMPPMPPAAQPPWAMVPSTSTNSPHAGEKRERASSPDMAIPDDWLEPFPDIAVFLQQISDNFPRRGLDAFINIFTDNDYYTVNDLRHFAPDRLTAPPFTMTPGNADFLVQEIQKTIKKVELSRAKEIREAKRARKP
ncbi:hypothetical protein CVT24_012185 [Panaeolus cyanescens]|uniref:Uncharacterized protein n=1 Tax=Panaeolus cyanescens TaxID=181874 RepID=A0A409X156_9AGAR|nr:hypothetical protein CVT24_012185 [Panaeolus cyanescens]